MPTVFEMLEEKKRNLTPTDQAYLVIEEIQGGIREASDLDELNVALRRGQTLLDMDEVRFMEEQGRRIRELTAALAKANKTLSEWQAALSEEPDGYVVVQASTTAPRGVWFVGIYHEKATAELVMRRSPSAKGERIKRVFYHPEDA